MSNPLSIKVNCSFCQTEIESPPDMLGCKYHACYDCFLEKEELSELDEGQLHVDAPMDEIAPNVLVSKLMEDGFPEVWSRAKGDIKEMSKREIAEEMFAAGAYSMVQMMMGMKKEMEQDHEEEPEP